MINEKKEEYHARYTETSKCPRCNPLDCYSMESSWHPSQQSLVESLLNDIDSPNDRVRETPLRKPGNNIGWLRRLVHSGQSEEKICLERRSFLNLQNLDEDIADLYTTNDIYYDDVSFNGYLTRDMDKVRIPSIFFNDGLPLSKVSPNSKRRALFYINVDNLVFILQIVSSSPSSGPNISKLLSPASSNLIKGKTYSFSSDDIKAIFYQREGGNYREELHISKEFENRWITIIYYDKKKRKMKTIHLIADTEHDLKKLFSTLLTLDRLKHNLAKNFLVDLNDIDDVLRNLIVGNLKKNVRPTKQFLSFQDILKYSKRLNVNINYDYLRLNFDLLKKDSPYSDNGGLNFEQFKVFVSILKERNDIMEIFKKFCDDNELMSFQQFEFFMRNVQRDYHGDSYALKFNKFCSEGQTKWSAESFNNFLLSKYCKPIRAVDLVKDYYNYPLNNYYISSSHNTYLMGRQVAGGSSIEGYIKALQKGCRCIEIDIWDGNIQEKGTNSLKDGPVVNHGRTFTKSISFRNVLKTIKKYAFITSPLPLIISLEVRCSSQNQLKTRDILQEILGGSLITQALDEDAILPRPSQCMHKILLKVKKSSSHQEGNSDEISRNYSLTSSTTTSVSEDNGNSSSVKTPFSLKKKVKVSRVVEELSSFAIYIQGIKFKNFSLPESKTYNHCLSLSEKSVNSMVKDPIKYNSLVKHNRKFLMRVYPSKMRLKSSNFIPIVFWSYGVQMVATNWQTYDLGQQINEAFFFGSNRKGYILKPKALREILSRNTGDHELSKLRRAKFNIEIISAHQLPKTKSSSAINPFVTLEFVGAHEVQWDTKSCNRRTSVRNENGFNPTWNERFTGVLTYMEDLIFVRFLINTRKSSPVEDEIETIGIFVCKLFDLNKGYRYLPIFDNLGEELVYSSLFVRIDYD